MSLADESLLATEPTFIARVKAAMLEMAVAVGFESINAANHTNRLTLATMVWQNAAVWANNFAGTIATDANVISDATAAGTVVLTAANIVAQAALITDAHIRSAVTGSWAYMIGVV